MAALDSDVSDVEGSIGTALDRSPITTPPIHTPTNVTPGGSKLRGPTFDFSQDPQLFFQLRQLELAGYEKQREFDRRHMELLDRQQAEQRAFDAQQASEKAEREKVQADRAREQREFDLQQLRAHEDVARAQADREAEAAREQREFELSRKGLKMLNLGPTCTSRVFSGKSNSVNVTPIWPWRSSTMLLLDPHPVG